MKHTAQPTPHPHIHMHEAGLAAGVLAGCAGRCAVCPHVCALGDLPLYGRYDLRNFQHPGGPVAKSLVGGREGTALFEAHHPFTSRSKLMAVLAKFKVRVSADDEPVQSPVFEQCDKARANKAKNDEKAEEKPRMPTAAELDSLLAAGDDGAHYKWNSGDAFELELKQEVKRYFEGEAKRRGVSFTQATKATPLRWLQILGHCAMFCSTVPAIVRGEWWALIVCPTLCWVAMVNYWHDACHFALSSRWYHLRIQLSGPKS